MSFQQGLSGLSTSSKTLDVVGNNIANASTVGFKGAQAQFADVFAASLSGASASNIGLGSKLATVAQQFTRGNISVTNNALDVAINGGGFYIVSDGGANYYSRNGQFQVDANGYLVTSTGMNLQGVLLDPTEGTEAGTLDSVQLFNPTSSSDSAAQATGDSSTQTGVVLGINLDSREAPPTTTTFSASSPTSYNQTSAITVYDSLGNPHSYTLYYVKQNQTVLATTAGNAAAVTGALGTYPATAGAQAAAVDAAVASLAAGGSTAAAEAAADAAAVAAGATSDAADATAVVAALLPYYDSANALYPINKWDVYASVTNPAGSSTGATAQSLGLLGSMKFGTNGALVASYSGNSTTPDAVTGEITQAITDAQLGYTNGVDPLNFTVNFGSATQYGSNFTVNTASQDGYSSGKLSGFNIGADGVIVGNYTNGQTQYLYKIKLASFRNPQGLQSQGGNVWSQSSASGQPVVGNPGSSGSYGPLQSSATEDSNVDITSELVAMITAQRIYQANAQTIKTQDQVLQTLVNLR